MCFFGFALLSDNYAATFKNYFASQNLDDKIFNGFISIIIQLYSYLTFRFISKMEYSGLAKKDLYKKFILIFEITGTTLNAFQIGFIMKNEPSDWIFFFYLIINQISSIGLQTNLIQKTLYILKVFFIKIFKPKTQYQYEGRLLHRKFLASRKIIFTVIIYIKLFSFAITGQWDDYHINNTKGCLLQIPDDILIQISFLKIFIFLTINTAIDVACVVYNKRQNFKEIIYFIPEINCISYGISLYLVSFFFEIFFAKVVFIY